jgi:hypothetical protein
MRVGPCEVVEQPHSVADPIALVVGYRTHIDVKRLADIRPWVRRARIKAAQFAVDADDVFHQVQDFWKNDGAPEDFPFVNQVREAMRVFFGSEFMPSRIAFFVEQLEDAVAQFA